MAHYFFYQPSDVQNTWEIALSSERDRITTEVKPALVTVLDVDNSFQTTLTPDENFALKYRGPVYADFDKRSGDTLEDVIGMMQQFIEKLQEYSVPLDSVRFYASGGKGFHVEIPIQVVKEKVPPAGITMLPLIIREFAYNLYVDCMDMNVYSTKKGRMWRCPNVLRSNGKYKVPVTAAEIMVMDEERYGEITSAPRPFTALSTPVLNGKLAVLFSMAEEKVLAGLKRRKASFAGNQELIRRFKGEWPASIKSIMAGDNLKEGIGFQRIAMQLAITANALGKDRDVFLKDCEGLCDKHQGDGTRYNTFRKRQNELCRMFDYMRGNPCYDFAASGLKAIAADQGKTTDLDQGDAIPEDDLEEEGDQEDDTIGIKAVRSGLFARGQDGWKKVSDAGFTKPRQLIDPETGETLGYDVEFFVDSTSKGSRSLTMGYLQSRQALQSWTSKGSASVQANDAQVSMLQDYLRRKAEKNGGQTYIIRREGLDLIRPAGTRDLFSDYDIVWSNPLDVSSRKGLNYKYMNAVVDNSQLWSDLVFAPQLVDNDLNREMFHRLFRSNKMEIIAPVFGWMMAAFICQFIRAVGSRRFPLLYAYGESGAGKTSIINLFAGLHYFQNKVVAWPASSGTTMFAIQTAATSSASVPVILEEIKASIDIRRFRLIDDLMKNNYTGEMLGRGSVKAETGKSSLTVVNSPCVAPLVGLGEQMLTETALMERLISVPFSKSSRMRNRQFRENFEWCDDIDHRPILGQFGGMLMRHVMAHFDLRMLFDEMKANISLVRSRVGDDSGGERPIYNNAVVLTGIELGRKALSGVFNTLFDDDAELMKSTILHSLSSSGVKVASEASKVLDALAMLASPRNTDISCALIVNQDYTISADGRYLDLGLKYAFVKYMRWCKNTGQTALYNDISSFVTAMRHYSGMVTTNCSDNTVIYKSPADLIFRFSIGVMEEEGIESFIRR